MKNRQLKTVFTPSERLHQLEAEFLHERHLLQEAEKALAEEQAAVNAFRMHCRLTIGHWVDTLVDLRSEKQALITRKRLLQQDLGLDDLAIYGFSCLRFSGLLDFEISGFLDFWIPGFKHLDLEIFRNLVA